MASVTPNGTVPPGADSPFMKLPEHIDGFVDLGTLVDIHKYLSESERSDDVVLAAWVKAHYLQEPLIEEGRQIRDTEGFVKLDTAYRRVRQLTGKAQDKWPFFDRKWKKMSSTVVKNLVLGDAATGLNRPVTDGEARDSPMSNGFHGQHDSTADAVSQQGPEQKNLRQAPERSPAPLVGSVGESDDQNGHEDISTLNGTVNGTEPSLGSLQDAGAGKIRGRYGRFVNKRRPPHPTAKAPSGPNIKYVKKGKSKSNTAAETEEESYSNDEPWPDVGANNNAFSATTPDDFSATIPEGNLKNDSKNSLAATELEKDVQPFESTSNGSPSSSILAAEAEAVPSNLDRLPPGSASKKRKNESAVQRGNHKRARGSKGGVLGRPRKSEPAVMNAENGEEDMEVTQTPSQPEAEAKVATRRSTRKSVPSAVEPPTPTKPIGNKSPDVVQQQQPSEHGIDTTNDVGGTSNEDLPILRWDEQVVRDDIMEPEDSSSSMAPAATSRLRVSKTQKTPTSSKRKKRVSFSPETELSNVEVFARITTSTGVQEIPLTEDDLTSEVLLIKRYAAWQNSEAANVTFETFKNIVKFAK